MKGYWLAARSLAPIDQIMRTAQRISADELHAWLNLPTTNDEVGRLAGIFDGVLAPGGRVSARTAMHYRCRARVLHPLTAMQAIVSVTRGNEQPTSMSRRSTT